MLTWEPPTGNKYSPLFYFVTITNESGVAVQNVTLAGTQLIIAIPDPCEQYNASVTAQYTSIINCTGFNATTSLAGGNEFVCAGLASCV